MPSFTQPYVAPIAQNLLGPPIWYKQGRSAQALTQMESSRSPTNIQTRANKGGKQSTFDKQPMEVDISGSKSVRQNDNWTTGRKPSGNKGATEQHVVKVSAKTSGSVDRIVEPEVVEYQANGAESTCLDVVDVSLKHTCETDVGAQELNDSCQVMEINESTLEQEF